MFWTEGDDDDDEKMSESILHIQEKPDVDESIREYEYVEYQPSTGSQLNSSGQITITIENTDDFYHPRHSWLLVEGDLMKADGVTRYAAADLVTLTNNAILFLFTNMKYSLSGQEIESLNHTGIGTLLLGLAKYSAGFEKGPGLMQCWYPDTGTTAVDAENIGFRVRRSFIVVKPVPRGSFSFAIPLEHVFGFCEDYDKVMYGMRHTLTLVRTSDNDAIFRGATADAGIVKLSKISWMMPRVQPNDEMKYKLYKTIESKAVLDASFRMRQCNVVEIPANATSFSWRLGVRTAPEKPRYVIVGIQADKSGNQEHNASLFDHSSVKNMSVVLNSTKYPPLDANASFAKHQFTSFYKAMTEFTRDYYGLDPLVGGCGLHPIEYKELTPIFIFNVSKQSERLNRGVVDVTVEMQFAPNGVAANTKAYALVISDRQLKLQSDGKKMNVLY